jgi:alkylation response protein AidB-like acyl-CoA dehydrogenase
LRTTAVMLLLATVQRADTVAANLTPQEPGLVKHVVSESAIEVLQKAVALVGNPALTRAHPLERRLRDDLCARLHSPQSASVLKAAGIAALKSNVGPMPKHHAQWLS